MALFWLSDEAWLAIEPHLPRNQPGARRVDDRRVISGILHVLKVGCRWCDCPADVRDVSGCQHQGVGPTDDIGDRVDLGRPTAARAANRLNRTPPFPRQT